MKLHPDAIYCLPVRTNPPWDPKNELRIRDMVQRCKTSRDFHTLCTCRGYRSLHEMLNCFEVFLPIVRGNLSLIEELAFDFCQRQSEQHVVYTEVRYSPHLLAESFNADDGDESAQTNSARVTPHDVLEAVTKGLRRGCTAFHITVNQILCGIAWRPDWALSTIEMAAQHQSDFPCATVGVDIAAGEEHFDESNFPDLYGPHFTMAQEAKKRSIPLTIHAGESTDNALENIQRAVIEYGARRIGHGYRMTESPAVMQLVREHDVHVEVCPTSSDETGGWNYEGPRDWKKHPAVVMREHGVSISLSSDDPAVFHTSLAWQYRLALARMELTKRDLVEMNAEAINAAFCTVETRMVLTELIVSYGKSNGINGFDHHSQHNERDGKVDATRTRSFQDRVYVATGVYS
jgi:adenosine deaminase